MVYGYIEMKFIKAITLNFSQRKKNYAKNFCKLHSEIQRKTKLRTNILKKTYGPLSEALLILILKNQFFHPISGIWM